MPIMSCSKGGKSGYKWGKNGHCYTGSGARAKAAKQGRAIKSSQHKGKKK